MPNEPREASIDELLRDYADALGDAVRVECDVPEEEHATDPDLDRAWQRVAELRTAIGLRIRALEASSAACRELVVSCETYAYNAGLTDAGGAPEPPLQTWDWAFLDAIHRARVAQPAGGEHA